MLVEGLLVQRSRYDIQRAAYLKWRDAPSGMSAELAHEFMGALKAGSTVRKLTCGERQYGPAMVTPGRFKKHCELNPEWAKEAINISKENVIFLKGAWARRMTLCRARLHPMVGNNVKLYGNGVRRCVACAEETAKRIPTPLTEAEKEKLKSLFAKGITFSQVCQGKPIGGGQRNPKLRIADARDLRHARASDSAFDKFLTQAMVGNKRRGQQLRWSRSRARVARAKSEQDARDYFAIQAMVPAWVPRQNKFDVVNSVAEDFWGGRIDRDGLRARVAHYVNDINNNLHPVKFAKFGDSPLVSLDEALFVDGSTTRGDTISRGLWD
jgi:hypothetical protein